MGSSERNGHERQEHNEPVPADRLIEASDAVLRAIDEVEQTTGGPCPHPVQLMGAANQPKCLVEFTRHEVQEACDFLERLGVMKTMAK